MRGIRFRQYIAQQGQFAYWGFIGGGFLAPTMVDGQRIEAPHEQFTGLTDKDDNPIYEGDIVRYQDFNTKDREWKVANVCWLSWADWARVPFLHPFGSPVGGQDLGGGRGLNMVYVHPPAECEIIGNIHENPELLVESNGRKDV